MVSVYADPCINKDPSRTLPRTTIAGSTSMISTIRAGYVIPMFHISEV